MAAPRRDPRPAAGVAAGLLVVCLGASSLWAPSAPGAAQLAAISSASRPSGQSIQKAGRPAGTSLPTATNEARRRRPTKPTSFTSGALLYKRTHAVSDAARRRPCSRLGLPLDLNGTYHCAAGSPGYTASLAGRADLCARRALFSGLGGFSVHYYESHTTQDGAVSVGDWVDAWTSMHNFSAADFSWNEFVHQGMTFWAPTLDPGHVVEIVSRNVSDPKPFSNYSEVGECPEANHLASTMAELEDQWTKFGGSSHAEDLGLPDLLIAQITMPVANEADTPRFGDFLRTHLSPRGPAHRPVMGCDAAYARYADWHVGIETEATLDYSAARLCANDVGFKNGGTTNLTQLNLTTTAGPFNWTAADANITNAILGSNWCRGTNGLGVEFRGTYDFDFFKSDAIRLLDYCSPTGNPRPWGFAQDDENQMEWCPTTSTRTATTAASRRRPRTTATSASGRRHDDVADGGGVVAATTTSPTRRAAAASRRRTTPRTRPAAASSRRRTASPLVGGDSSGGDSSGGDSSGGDSSP
ncbi:hypothetical protein JL721_4075 [Aureococcus anophagefferens]|nr:hypothetical protein JL721_4075 [Aureococcus anophagefferens]